jgi:dUTP pyrophosphatase
MVDRRGGLAEHDSSVWFGALRPVPDLKLQHDDWGNAYLDTDCIVNNTVVVAVQKLPGNEDLPLPRYMTEHAAGLDLLAAVRQDVELYPGQREIIPTGLAISLPEGYEAQIRPRSGLAWKHGITLVNAPGTVDADYRGEIRILLINHGNSAFVIRRGDRIAQMVVQRVCRVQWDVRPQLNPTSRGEGGFGHTKN